MKELWEGRLRCDRRGIVFVDVLTADYDRKVSTRGVTSTPADVGRPATGGVARTPADASKTKNRAVGVAGLVA